MKTVTFIQLYDYVISLPTTSHDLPITVNGKRIVDVALTEDFEIALITE